MALTAPKILFSHHYYLSNSYYPKQKPLTHKVIASGSRDFLSRPNFVLFWLMLLFVCLFVGFGCRCLVGLVFICLRQELTMYPRLASDALFSSGWPLNQSDPLISTSCYLPLWVCLFCGLHFWGVIDFYVCSFVLDSLKVCPESLDFWGWTISPCWFWPYLTICSFVINSLDSVSVAPHSETTRIRIPSFISFQQSQTYHSGCIWFLWVWHLFFFFPICTLFYIILLWDPGLSMYPCMFYNWLCRSGWTHRDLPASASASSPCHFLLPPFSWPLAPSPCLPVMRFMAYITMPCCFIFFNDALPPVDVSIKVCCLFLCLHFKNTSLGPREMAQQLRVLATLPKDLTLISSTHFSAQKCLKLQFQRFRSPLLAFLGTRNTQGTQAYM